MARQMRSQVLPSSSPASYPPFRATKPSSSPNALAGAYLSLSFPPLPLSFPFHRTWLTPLSSRVTGQPSGKTDYVVLGDNAGDSKLRAIKKHGLKTLTEDEFLALIGSRNKDGKVKVDEKTRKKMEKEQAEIEKAAAELVASSSSGDAEFPGPHWRRCLPMTATGNLLHHQLSLRAVVPSQGLRASDRS